MRDTKFIPRKPARPCSKPGCPELVYGSDRYCEAHKEQERLYDRARGSAAARGYDSRWRKARLGFLRQNPLCVHCQAEGRITPATVVDHIIPHKGDQDLFWDRDNWQALCKQHHDIKTGTERGRGV